MGFPGEDAVLVGDSVQGLGDVQEGVAAVHNPRHLLGAGSEFVIHQLRERLPQLVLVTWKTKPERLRGGAVGLVTVQSSPVCFGVSFYYRTGQRKEKEGDVGTITERVPIVVL